MRASNTDTIFRITALWAFSECALGGVMHALKMPFTGIFVGGFAVLCIGLLAHASGRKASVILRSTVLVILVKALVSPHSPPTAYFAVGFQGVAGALILCHVKPYALAAYLFGFLAIVESAVQKVIMLSVFFGKPLFEALDIFVGDVLKLFGFQSGVSGSALVVGGYIALYGLWGLVLGFWLTCLPGQIEARMAEYRQLTLPVAGQDFSEKKRARPKWLLAVGILLFIVLTFLLAGGKASGVQRAMYAVLRTLAVLVAWFYIVQPVVTWHFRRWAKKKSEQEKGALQQIMEFMPDLRTKVGPLYRYVSKKHGGWRRLTEFVAGLFVVAVYRDASEKEAHTP